MITTGIIRKIDDLGRIVIPREIRKKLFGTSSNEGKPMEFFYEKNGTIIMKPTDIVDKYNWIIGISNSETNGVKLFKFFGSIDEVKEKLISMVIEDRKEDEGNWEYGSETIEDIEDKSYNSGYEFYGYGSYNSYHIDYTAKEISNVINIWLKRLGKFVLKKNISN